MNRWFKLWSVQRQSLTQTASSLNTIRSVVSLWSCCAVCFKAGVSLAGLYCTIDYMVKHQPCIWELWRTKNPSCIINSVCRTGIKEMTVGNILLLPLLDSSSLLSPISNSPLRGFTPLSTKSCLLGQGGIPGVKRDRWLSPQGMYVGAGRELE